MEINKELVEQMEKVKDYGACNMMLYPYVMKLTLALGLHELASLTEGEYSVLVSHVWEKGYE